MKKILTILMLIFTVFSLSACNGNFPKAEANIDPATINWGTGTEGDRWYLDGKEGNDYLIFSRAETGKACYICESVTESGKTEITCTALEGHLTAPGDIVDFIFPDNFTAYDTISETYYSRGDAEALRAAIGDLTFIEKTDETNVLKLTKDGACKEKYLGNSYSGTWELVTPDTVCCSFQNDDFPYEFVLVKNEKGDITGLKQGDQGRRFTVKAADGTEEK